MELGGDGTSVYAEAKSEYTKQLCQFLVPSIQQYFLDLLEEAKHKEPDPRRLLVMFQTLLEDISDWNVDKVQRETGTIINASQCDYLDELMTAVFIAHTKVLSAIRLTTKQKKLQITIPKIDHFIHRILRECSRLLWSNTYLFSTSSPSMERQRNLRTIENFLHEGVLQGIRSMLPVKNILREYLKDDDAEDEDEAEAEADADAEAKEAEAEAVAEAKAEAKVEAKVEAKAEDKLEPELKIEVKAEPKPVSNTIIVENSPISFTGNDTLDNLEDAFDNISINSDTDNKNSKDNDKDTDEESDGENEYIEILDNPPEPMDGFEDLDKKDPEELPMDFESLD